MKSPKRLHIKTKPVNINKLISSAGLTQAGIKLGLTPSALNKYVKADLAPLATEIAAKSLCTANTDREESTILLRGDVDIVTAIKKIAIRGGASYTEIK